MNTALDLMSKRITHNREQQYKDAGLMIIHSSRLRNYLEENGIFPVREYGDDGYYHRSKKLNDLLTNYTIEYSCIPNKL